MKKIILILACFLTSCTNDSEARRTLEAQGFDNIRIGGYAWFGCGQDDGASNTFTATNAKGQAVSGVVCCGTYEGNPLGGLAKGCTVRF